MQIQDNTNPYLNFMYALNAPETKRQYPKRFQVFFNFLGMNGSLEQNCNLLYEKSISNVTWLQSQIINFFRVQKNRVENEEIALATVRNYYKPIKLFCDMNNILVNWKLISKGLPKGNQVAKDRIPTREEILKLIDFADVRMKPIILTIITSGIRIGAWDTMQLKHITPKLKNGEVIAAKLLVYPGSEEQYFTFITSEAYNSLKVWMDFRESFGEKITGDSWVMRDLWRIRNQKYGNYLGSAKNPIKLQSGGIRMIITRALHVQGIRNELMQGENRHEFKTVHGFRKYFKTVCEQYMRPANVEVLMGHSIGISDSYYRPKESELLNDYLNAIDALTLNEENRLKRQVSELETKQAEISLMKLDHQREIKNVREEMHEKIDQLIS
ncbi:MAG: hypothetical protein WB511_10445, partial [Nitrososphaeraceae archaeon]